MYISSVFLKCGGSVVFLNILENDVDEMNILSQKREKQEYFWSEVCELSWDPLVCYGVTLLLTHIRATFVVPLFYVFFLLFDVYDVLAVESLETGEDATDEIGTQRKKLKLETGSVSHPTEKSLGLLALQSSETGEDATDKTGTTGKKLKRKTRSVGRPPNKKSFGLVQGRPHLTPDQVAKFDDYLDTLEDMLVMPEIETTPSDNLTPTILDDNETIECCKKKLSSLLAVDFSSLVSRGDVAEVATLAAQIREDPSLSVDQLFKLKLVEQVPLASEAFLEAKKNIEEVDNFLADLEAKKLKVPSLRKEYNELKDKIGQQEAEMDISTLTIREIDDQIRQLQAKRNRITNGLETMKKTKAELTSELTNVANSISTIGHDIKHGLSQKSKLELKKANNIRRVAEIQEKFITLRGLTF